MEGPEVIDLQPGTQPGAVVRLRGKGMPRLRQIGMGDQLVTVHVQVPRNLSARGRELLEAYAEEMGEPINERETLLGKLKGIFGKRGKGKEAKAKKEPTEAH
jgi:molecular chaperone DnaJ